MSRSLIIYSRQHCELCEIAAGMATVAGVDWIYQDITEDLQLLRRYRNIIPVIRNPDTDKELRWPFEEHHIRTLGGTS